MRNGMMFSSLRPMVSLFHELYTGKFRNGWLHRQIQGTAKRGGRWSPPSPYFAIVTLWYKYELFNLVVSYLAVFDIRSIILRVTSSLDPYVLLPTAKDNTLT